MRDKNNWIMELITEMAIYNSQVYFWTVEDWTTFLNYRKLAPSEVDAFGHLDNYKTALRIRKSRLYKLLNEEHEHGE